MLHVPKKNEKGNRLQLARAAWNQGFESLAKYCCYCFEVIFENDISSFCTGFITSACFTYFWPDAKMMIDSSIPNPAAAGVVEEPLTSLAPGVGIAGN